MLAVMQQINSVPGVMGCFVCGDDGKVSEQAFPPLYDLPMLEEAALAITDCALAMEHSTGGLEFLDLRFNDVRVLVKTLTKSYLLLLCQKDINLSLLTMSLNVAAKRLDRLVAARESAAQAPQAAPQAPPLAAPMAAPAYQPQAPAAIPVVGKGLGLSVLVQEKTASTYWASMLASVAMNRSTAVQLSDHFKTGTFRKVKLTNMTTKVSKKFPVTIITSDSDHLYDGKAILTLGAIEAIGAKAGDTVMAELDIGGGLLGWEMI
ncbi:hypothetical protein GMSM_10340 [Geomonas sp. Red276]